MSPGSTVAWERSMTVAPSGVFAPAASATFSIRFPRITITWFLRGESDLPSISVPARITTMDVGGAAALCADTKFTAMQTIAQRQTRFIDVPRMLADILTCLLCDDGVHFD